MNKQNSNNGKRREQITLNNVAYPTSQLLVKP